MSNQQKFIEEIAPIVQKYVQQYGYGVASAVIAQACLESAYGTSNKAKHHNYFGLKYRPNRVSVSNGTFVDGSKEQNSNGSYVSITDKWFGFANMDAGVQGYFQFISISNYDKAKQQTDPKKYLQALMDAGYATSIEYVENCMAVISAWGLTKYDGKKKVSKKVSVENKPKITRKISKYNHESRDGRGVKYIVMHYTGNQTDTAAANANYFYGGNRGASAHYFVDSSDIYQSVEDINAAWHVGKNYGKNNLFGRCTNKNSIGIEMCSSHGQITAKTIANAVDLVKYLMKKYDVPADRVVRHYDVCSKRCPGWGGWLPPDESKWIDFKKQLGGKTTKAKTEPKKEEKFEPKADLPFLVQVLIDDLNIRKGPGTKYDRTGKFTGKGKFTIVEVSPGQSWGKLKSGAGWIRIDNPAWVKKF